MLFDKKQLDPRAPQTEGDDLPEASGLKRFWQILQEHCAAVVKLNLLFLVSCLPVVTIPPALLAAHQVIRKMVLDEPVACLRDYMAAFKAGWKRGYGAFCISVLPMAAGGYGIRFYLANLERSYLLVVPFALCACMFWVVTLSSTYLYGLLCDGRPFRQAVRTALFLALARPLRAFLAALCWYGLPLAAILAFPLSGAYLLLIGFALPFLLGSFYIRTVLRQLRAPDK